MYHANDKQRSLLELSMKVVKITTAVMSISCMYSLQAYAYFNTDRLEPSDFSSVVFDSNSGLKRPGGYQAENSPQYRLRLAQSSSIFDFIQPIFKGFNNSEKRTKPSRSVPPILSHPDISSSQRKLSVKPKNTLPRQQPAQIVCVRLCDGYHWPVDKIALQGSSQSAREFCANQCSSPTKVYLNYIAGGTAKDLVDAAGSRYSDLENSFRYCKEYLPSCRCGPNPWDATEQNRHAGYAGLAKDSPIEKKPLGGKSIGESQRKSTSVTEFGWSAEVRAPR